MTFFFSQRRIQVGMLNLEGIQRLSQKSVFTLLLELSFMDYGLRGTDKGMPFYNFTS